MARLIEFSFSSRRRQSIRIASFGLLLSIVTLHSVGHAAEEDAMSLQLGGCGGIYFYASPGELWIEVQKQDLNIRGNKTHLLALLLVTAVEK